MTAPSNLQLVSTPDLIKELMDRTEGLVLAYGKTRSGNNPVIETRWSNKAVWIELLGMAALLKHHLAEAYEEQEAE